MKRIYIILEDPKYSGNIGMICRLIANFSSPPLRIIGKEKPLDFEMEWMAHNSHEELQKIEYFESVESCLEDISISIGTGMIKGRDRGPFMKLTELPEFLQKSPERIGILFGREDTGLKPDTITFCDYMVHFDLPGYQPSMNLANSVAYFLSILYNYPLSTYQKKEATVEERKQFYSYTEDVFKLLGMNFFHRKKNLAVKRLKGILESRPLNSGDLGFLYKIFRNIENLHKKKK